MKSLRSYIAAATVLMAVCTAPVFAQTSNNVPASVSAAFASKYPNARIKKWFFDHNTYTAKAIGARGKFLAAFDGNGNWEKTTSIIHWSWNLPIEVRSGIRQSKYAAWKIDGIHKIESPSVGYYQVCVDNHFLLGDEAHAAVFTENRVLNIQSDGRIVAEKSISSPLLF